MRVVINAQVDPESCGGIAQVLAGLAHGLSQLDAPDEFLFVCTPKSAAWLRPYVGLHQQIAVNDRSTPSPRPGVRASDGFWESFAPDVLHFPYQAYTRTAIPTVFNPHDLQHVHLPEFFSTEEIQRRESLLREACRMADAVAIASQFVKDDLAAHYQLSTEKIHVIGWPAPTSAYKRPTEARKAAFLHDQGLVPGFAFYPAQTWPHKNHLCLLEALAVLRQDFAVILPLVCTGGLTDHFARIRERIAQLDLTFQARFLGRVCDWQLLCLYEAALCAVIPTLFEALSFPVMEAMAEGLPVACSNVTSLPEQVGEAGIIFDPRDPRDIARAMYELYRDEPLRRRLAKLGRKRAAEFSWCRTAESYVDLYRQVGRGTPGTMRSPVAVHPATA